MIQMHSETHHNQGNQYKKQDRIAEAVETYYPLAQRIAQGDSDLQQELMLSVLDSVGTRNLSDRGRIIGRMLDQRKAYKSGYLTVDRYGNSIDNGCYKRRQNVTRLSFNDTYEKFIRHQIISVNLAIYFTNPRNPEETALFNVDYERFLAHLTPKERGYWNARLEGKLSGDIARLKIAKKNDQGGIRRDIREKFRVWMEQ